MYLYYKIFLLQNPNKNLFNLNLSNVLTDGGCDSPVIFICNITAETSKGK